MLYFSFETAILLIFVMLKSPQINDIFFPTKYFYIMTYIKDSVRVNPVLR